MAADPQGSRTDFKSVRNLKDASSLAAKRRELESFRTRDKIDWSLNRAFYNNNQWSFWNKSWPGGGRLETEPTDEGDKSRYKVRLTSNEVTPGVQHYTAQLTKNRPVIYGTPDSSSDSDLKAAQMATSLWEYWWSDMQMSAKLQTSVLDSALSQGYWHITWDALAGKAFNFMVDPNGQPLLGANWDDEALDIYREALQEHGLDPSQFQRTVYVGDISVKTLQGEQVLLDPAARKFDEANYAIVIDNMDPDILTARWPKDKAGNPTSNVGADATPGDEAINPNMLAAQEERKRSVRRVYHGYFKKSPALPKGRYVCWIEGPDMILEDTDWNFPFDDLPIVHFPGIERPNTPLDMPVTTPSRPLQKEINRTVSQVVEHKNITLKPQVLAPVGSMPERPTNEPGRTIFFNPINGVAPQWRDIPQLPSYVFNHLGIIQQKLDKLFNRIPSQRDQLPARIDSTGSIDLIQEAVSDQISPIIVRLENALVRAGMLMVKLAQENYIEPRLLKIKGPNGAVQVKKFMNADLKGGFSLQAEAGSGLPRTRGGKESRIEFMLQNQLIDPRQALKYLDTADLTGLMAQQQADEEQAYRTIEKLRKGQILNQQAFQQAQAQVQQMMANPDPDGDGIPDPPEQKQAQAQQMLMQAAVAPQPYEDYMTHMTVLKTFMTGIEFDSLDPQIQQMFVTRFESMMTANFQLMSMSHEPPKTTMQIKATASVPVAGEILRRQGIQVQDEEVAEPPLDTWVSDDLTSPLEQSSGNTQLDQAGQIQQMQQANDTHAVKMARAAHETSLAAAKAQQAHQANAQSAESHALDHGRSEQMHAAKLRAALRPPAAAKA